MSSLINLIRKAAVDYVSKADVSELLMMLPKSVIEGEAPAPKRKLRKKELLKMHAISFEEASGAVPGKKKRRGRIPKKPGSFTNLKREEILKRVGSLPLKTSEYNSVRDEICRDLALNRRQVSKFIDETRKVTSGTSNIHKARAAKGRFRGSKKK